jgi:hypothetical protein
MLVSKIPATSSPHGVSVGAGAAKLTQVPGWLGASHRSSGPVQAELQQTLSTQKRVAHCDEVAQAPPWGTGVPVGVAVAVMLGLLVGVPVGVIVGVPLGVNVAHVG